MKCLLLSDDLMFSSQVVQTGRQADCDILPANSVASWIELHRQQPEVRRFIVDLNTRGLELAALVAAVSGSDVHDSGNWLAIGPHVHREKLEAARQLGWKVMTRGQFHADGMSFLQKWPLANSPTTLADGTTLANP